MRIRGDVDLSLVFVLYLRWTCLYHVFIRTAREK